LKHGKRVSRIRVHFEDEKYELRSVDRLGYGLPLAKKIMEVYGWAVKEEGEPSKGAKFVITIPRTNQNGKDNYQRDRILN